MIVLYTVGQLFDTLLDLQFLISNYSFVWQSYKSSQSQT